LNRCGFRADSREIALNSATILIVSFAFPPSIEIGARRATALARYLADNGIRVIVVSAFGDHPVKLGSELYPGVIAIPVKRPGRPWLDLLVALKRMVRSQRNAHPDDPAARAVEASQQQAAASLRARLREAYFRVTYFVDHYKKWSWRAAKAAIRAGSEHHAALILASGPPHSTLLAAAWAARKLDIPYVADLRDPWSDLLAVAHPNRRIELRLLRVLEGWVIRRAAAVTSTSATVAALLVDRDRSLTSKLHVVRNGYDGDVAPPLVHTGGRLSILFAGVLYVRRTPYPLLAALEMLLSRPEVDSSRIQLTFMGDKVGSFSDESLESWIQGKRVASVVRILPPQTTEVVATEVAQATALLNLAQKQHLHVPAKTYEQLAAGREILLICEPECETAQIVSGITGVIQVDQSDPQVLLAVLLDLYNRHVVAGTASAPAEEDVRRFSRALANERFHAVLASVATLHTPLEPASGVCRGSSAGSANNVDAQVTSSQAKYLFARQLLADARFYHGLTRAGWRGSGSIVWTLLCNRGLWLLTFHRIAHFCLRQRNVRSPLWWFARLCKSVGTCFNVLFCRSAFSADCEIRGAAYLSNRGYLNCGARSIGAGSLIHERCTFGYSVADGGTGRPIIGSNVWVGSSCIIAGSVTVGDGATVLPGSFVTFSVSPGAVVKGNPALIVRKNFDNSELRRSLTVVPDIATDNS
jgi:serine acetyltransferase